MNRTLQDDINYIIGKTRDIECLKDATILVTGGSGLIGSMLVRTLIELSKSLSLNLKIIVLTRNLDKAKAIFEENEVEFLFADIRDEIDFPDKLDYVIHCAAVTKSIEMVEYPVENLLTSIIGTKNILELAREKNVKSMVYISSMEVYGSNAQSFEDIPVELKQQRDNVVTEDMLGYIDLTSPRSSYPEGKRASECLCYAYHSQYGISVKIARLAQTFGAGVSEQDSRVFVQFAKSATQRKDIVMHTDGSSEGNYCYLADTIYGILTILLNGQSGEAYNVVNEKLHMTIKQMAKVVANDVVGGHIKIISGLPIDVAKLGYAPLTKLKLSSKKLRDLGWAPKYDMQDMYQRMINYWNE